MFRIVRVFDTRLRIDEVRVAQVLAILRSQFSGVPTEKIEALPEQLNDPLKHRMRHILFVAEGTNQQVRGFALLSHDPELRFCFLDYVSAAAGRTGGGIGGALYERVRDEARAFDAIGVFMECLPDDPALCSCPETVKQNIARLRFYERYGARPVINTRYEVPMSDDPANDCSPYLVFDALGRDEPVRRAHVRKIVRAILECKYGDLCSNEYNDTVVRSFRDPELLLRPPKYGQVESLPTSAQLPSDRRIGLFVNDRHDIHHIRERGYVEAPARLRRILRSIEDQPGFERLAVKRAPERELLALHDPDLVEYLKRVCERIGDGPSVYPYVFPVRNQNRRPVDLPTRAGYYCIDTFTPLNGNAWKAARGAVDCAWSAAELVAGGRRLAYALVRPPGHHAERSTFGGFCYFNNAGVAANRLSRQGRVAILDVDYHHGNGQQDIFYDRPDVLTVSIHGHPRFAYPYFTGFEEERGHGAGEGFNVNIPLPENVDGSGYRKALASALRRIVDFDPLFLVVALGLDPAKGDPTGTWSLVPADFRRNGEMIGAMRLSTVVVQEGGYRIRTLGTNALRFFEGLAATAFG